MFHTDDAMFMSKAVTRIPRRYRFECLGLWLTIGQWCAHETTDGYCTIEHIVHQLSPLAPKSTHHRLGLLIDVALNDEGAGLLTRCEWNGQPAVMFRDWDVWQDTATDTRRRRDGWREQKRRQRAAARAENVSENSSRIRREYAANTPQTRREYARVNLGGQDKRELSTVDTPLDTGQESGPPLSLNPQLSSYLPTDALSNAHANSSHFAGKIVDKHLGREYASAVKTSMRLAVSELLHAGHDPADVEAAVELWTSRPGTSPKILPHLLSDVTRARNHRPPGFGAASTKAQGHLDVAAELIAERQAARGESPPPPKELEA